MDMSFIPRRWINIRVRTVWTVIVTNRQTVKAVVHRDLVPSGETWPSDRFMLLDLTQRAISEMGTPYH